MLATAVVGVEEGADEVVAAPFVATAAEPPLVPLPLLAVATARCCFLGGVGLRLRLLSLRRALPLLLLRSDRGPFVEAAFSRSPLLLPTASRSRSRFEPAVAEPLLCVPAVEEGAGAAPYRVGFEDIFYFFSEFLNIYVFFNPFVLFSCFLSFEDVGTIAFIRTVAKG